MGVVYLGRAVGLAGFQRTVAVKCCHEHLLDEGDFVAMFLDEARLAARIHHPNVVATLDVNQHGRTLYMVLDYIEGVSLADLLLACARQKGLLPVPVALTIVRDMLSGLHAAHDLRDHDGEPLNLVHRDVSPHNVLIGTDGLARIMDFGVAKAESRLAITKLGLLKGKIPYMSPEQVSQQPVTGASDQFAAGIVLWETLTGCRLFHAESEAAVAERIRAAKVPAPDRLRPSVSARVSAIVTRALSRDPADRHPTAAAMAEAIERSGVRLASAREIGKVVELLLPGRLAALRKKVREAGVSTPPPELDDTAERTARQALPATDLTQVTTRRLSKNVVRAIIDAVELADTAVRDVIDVTIPDSSIAELALARYQEETDLASDDGPTVRMDGPPPWPEERRPVAATAPPLRPVLAAAAGDLPVLDETAEATTRPFHDKKIVRAIREISERIEQRRSLAGAPERTRTARWMVIGFVVGVLLAVAALLLSFAW
jgi:serine/threonine protein kinase